VKRPEFFIVGAPKSGTTFMNDRLRDHPRIFMPWRKEPHFFGRDLRLRRERLTEKEYLALFRDAEPDQLVGEASVWYLASKTAAEEIKAFSPAARIIIMLRNPVDMIRSLHQQMIFSANEDIRDLRQAVEAEPDRRLGRRIPRSARSETATFYIEAATYSPQVERYFDVHGRDRVHLVLYDDLAAEPQGVYDRTLEFLGLEPGHRISPSRVNAARAPRSRRLQALLHSPRGVARAAGRKVLPYRQRIRLVTYLQRLNTRPAPAVPLDPETRGWLGGKLEEDVRRLGDLIDRDLSPWISSWRD
jgi:hypothetical protein